MMDNLLNPFPDPPRPESQRHVINLQAEPLDTVRIAVVGLGRRGGSAVERLCQVEGTRITVIADPDPERLENARVKLESAGCPAAAEVADPGQWRRIPEREDVDLLYVCSYWNNHAELAVAAMEAGAHVAVEVPAALTVEEAWRLVDTAERTRRHCMMLENCNYDFFELATLRMVQEGRFGEIVHAEGAYIHELREALFTRLPWRLDWNAARRGNLYPTHGLGPLAHALNLDRGDRMEVLNCVDSAQFGLTAYARETRGAESPEAERPYRHGDMSTTLIRTRKGKTIQLQHDVVSPRPYSRAHLISGTRGIAQKYPREGLAFGHEWLPDDQRDALLKEYEFPFVSLLGDKARAVGGHGGMDYLMDCRLVHCLRHGFPLDQNVYDAASWSAVIGLSGLSAEHRGAPVRIPDFTRGAWSLLDRVRYFDADMDGKLDDEEAALLG